MTASDEAKKALEGVTPGPWRHAQEAVDPEWSVVTTSGGAVIANINDRADRHPNARFIAWAREGVPALLAEIAAKDAALAAINDKAIMNAGEFARFVRDTIAALKGDHHE